VTTGARLSALGYEHHRCPRDKGLGRHVITRGGRRVARLSAWEANAWLDKLERKFCALRRGR
jgi:hypothetical protein